MGTNFEEQDPKALPRVDNVEERLSDAERRVRRLEKKVEVLERERDEQ